MRPELPKQGRPRAIKNLEELKILYEAGIKPDRLCKFYGVCRRTLKTALIEIYTPEMEE